MTTEDLGPKPQPHKPTKEEDAFGQKTTIYVAEVNEDIGLVSHTPIVAYMEDEDHDKPDNASWVGFAEAYDQEHEHKLVAIRVTNIGGAGEADESGDWVRFGHPVRDRVEAWIAGVRGAHTIIHANSQSDSLLSASAPSAVKQG